MKLLLDEMYHPRIAEALRARGHDVVAVAEVPALRGLADEDVLAIGELDEHCVVTENVKDFAPLGAEAVARGAGAPGIVLVSRRRFPRTDPGRLVDALDGFLAGLPTGLGEQSAFVWWLEAEPRSQRGPAG